MLSLIFGGFLYLSSNFPKGVVTISHDQSHGGVIPAVAHDKRKREATPIEAADVWSVLNEAHFNVKQERPTTRLIVGAWAHIMLENAHGKRVWNNNLGNVGNLPSDPPTEYYSHFGKAKYRSFDSIVKGAEAYWTMLYRCPMAVKYFEAGDAETASLSLKRCNYYRSDQESYSRILTALYERGSRISRARAGSR